MILITKVKVRILLELFGIIAEFLEIRENWFSFYFYVVVVSRFRKNDDENVIGILAFQKIRINASAREIVEFFETREATHFQYFLFEEPPLVFPFLLQK